jgi:hypothetical protein
MRRHLTKALQGRVYRRVEQSVRDAKRDALRGIVVGCKCERAVLRRSAVKLVGMIAGQNWKRQKRLVSWKGNTPKATHNDCV